MTILDKFKTFLDQESIAIIRINPNASSGGGKSYCHIEVSNVDEEESKQLISKFNASLKG